MNINEEARKMAVTAEYPGEMKIIVDGEKETVEGFTAKDVSAVNAPAEDQVYFTFAASAKMPVIISMKNGFSIVLKEIKTK